MKYIASALGICALTVVLLVSCNKINLPTEMGQDLIPPVDNIHTFDTTLEVETYNKLFTFADDSARSTSSNFQYLGLMNDPIFGKTDAQMFFQLVPENGKLTFKSVPGKRTIDSIVLSISYIGTYGDTTIPQTISVSELSLSNNFKADSAYSMRNNNFTITNLLGTSQQVYPYQLNDSTIDIQVKDTVPIGNQLRIRLNNSFGQRLLDYDTSGVNDAYSTDSIFLTKFGGFALKSTGGGNAIMGFVLNEKVNTRLSVYYHHENSTTPGDIDTAVAKFVLLGTTAYGATANYIGRDYSGTQVAATANDGLADELVYLQNSPGVYSTVKIPGLAGIKNSVIHLAQLQMEQVHDIKDTLFNTVPLFLDMLDNTTNRYKTIPYAVENSWLSPIDQFGTGYSIVPDGYRLFGSNNFYKTDPLGNKVKEWQFNLTRYVQYLVKGAVQPGEFRLYTSNNMVIENGNPGSGAEKIFVTNSTGPARGRVRLGGGNHPTQKMKLRIVYSKL